MMGIFRWSVRLGRVRDEERVRGDCHQKERGCGANDGDEEHGATAVFVRQASNDGS